MRLAGYRDSEIVGLGPYLRDALASSGAARVEMDDRVDALRLQSHSGGGRIVVGRVRIKGWEAREVHHHTVCCDPVSRRVRNGHRSDR